MSDHPDTSRCDERGRRIIELKFSPADDGPQYMAALRDDTSSCWVIWQVGRSFGPPAERREARVSREEVQQLLSRLAEVRMPLCSPPPVLVLGRYTELALDLSGLELRVAWQHAEHEWRALDEFAGFFGRWVGDRVGVRSYAFR